MMRGEVQCCTAERKQECQRRNAIMPVFLLHASQLILETPAAPIRPVLALTLGALRFLAGIGFGAATLSLTF